MTKRFESPEPDSEGGGCVLLIFAIAIIIASLYACYLLDTGGWALVGW